MTRAEQQNGFILLPVVLLISLVATLAFMLNHESAQDTGIVGSLAELKQSEYVAQAGLQHSLQQLAAAGCGPYTDFTDEPFGSHKYSASITPNNAGGVVTTYTVQVSDDAYIMNNASSAQNFGSDSQLQTFANLFLTDIRRSLFRFDIVSTGIPAGAQIISAVARIFVVDSNASTSVSVHQITADWTEAMVNWDNINTSHDAATIATIATGAPVGQYVNINITPIVQGWVNGSIVNQGVMLKTGSINDLAQYTSKEYGNIAQRPELIIKVTDGSLSNRADVTATGTLANGVNRTIIRNELVLYQQPPGALQLQPDAAEGQDAEIWDQAPNANYGDADETWVSSASNDTTRSLLRFNMAAIPYGARILGASLSLRRRSGSGAEQPVSAHRIKNLWSENTVTWNHRQPGKTWDTAGSDFDNMAVATTPVGPVNQRYEWNITPLVQGWVDGSYANYGVVLVAAIAGMPGERFDTSDHADPSRWPSLSITYTCECSTICLAPQGSGSVLLVVGDDVPPDPVDVKKQALFELWGYTVNLINDDKDQSNFDSKLALNDVAYVSETSDSSVLAGKLSSTTKGVVNEETELLNELGLSGSGSHAVSDNLEIIDNSHYITALFPIAALPIFNAAMEGMLVTGAPASGLQTLGNFSGTASLALVNKDGALGGSKNGENAAGHRVAIPIGSNNKFNWGYLNNNGRLIVQRAIQWGIDADVASPSGPIAHWKLDEANGTTAVDSVGGHDGTVVGNPTWSAGTLGGALDFDGAGDRVDVGSILDGSASQISVTAWVFKRDTGDDRVISKSSSTAIVDHIFSLGVTGTTIRTRLRTTDNGGTSNYDGGSIPLNQWVHLAFTYDGGMLRIYMDGAETASHAITGDMIASTLDVAIGNVNATDDRYWNGLLDDVRIYDRFLDPVEIADLAAQGGGGGGSPTIVEVRVATGNDDAEERLSNGNVGLTSSDLELISDGSNAQLVGMRFTGVAVPNGATITNAYIQFQVDETNTGATNVNIQGEAGDSALQFTSSAYNISSRSKTTTSIPWTPVSWTTVSEAGSDQRTPDISAVVQEIVNRTGWASGNDMVILISGSGERTAESYNGDLSGAALLHIEY
jgi:hypothetical protein